MELEDQIGRAEVIDISKLSGTSVKFGATVTLVDEDTDEKRKYQIVGDVESDAKKGRISLSSPIARALIGKSKGDTVEVRPRRRAVLRDPESRIRLTSVLWPSQLVARRSRPPPCQRRCRAVHG